MIIHRVLARKLKELAKQFRMVALTGPYGSGKSTLAKITFPDYAYVSLEDLDARERAETDPRKFLQTYDAHAGLIIDEAQRVPALFSYLQTKVDEKRRPGFYILTGSQNFLLDEQIAQSLAGRMSYLTLLPLSIEELKESTLLPQQVEQLMFAGSYPEVQVFSMQPTDWYSGYIRTYIERDVRLIKNIQDLGTFKRFVSLCAGRVGQLVNVTSLANDCGISNTTAYAWLSLLQASYIIFFLYPYFNNFSKRLIKTPTLYFYDTGLACRLLEIDSAQDLYNHYMRGALFESFVIAELMKEYYNHGLEPHLFFWRDKIGREVDCLIKKGQHLTPVEIKAGMTVSRQYFKELNYWNELMDRKEEPSYVVYAGHETQLHTAATVLRWQEIPTILRR